MEETSHEKNELNYIFPPFFSLPDPSNILNPTLANGLGWTIDGSQSWKNSGLSFEQNSDSSHDKCSDSAKNSAEMLKNFKQQWYKPRDTNRYKHLPFHTNICKKPAKIPRTNNSLQIPSVMSSSTSQEVGQMGNVAPADPKVLEEILNDPTGYINVQGKLREVRFYGEKSIVMMDWNDPRDVCFQSSSRRVIIDEKDILILSFNSPYTNYTFPDGSIIKIRLGTPTRDFYIDGKPVEVKFGGPPVNVLVGNTYHKIQLGGPSPKVYVGNVKRSDIMAGRINLIIDEDLNNIFHIYLDSKPQKLDINGVPFVLKFTDSLKSVCINERPFKTDFGGAPIAVKLYNEIHLLRFSALPPGIVPGLVHIVNMENKQTDFAIRTLFPSILPWNDPNLTSLTMIANNNHYNFNYHHHGEAANSEVSITKNNNLNLSSEKANSQKSTPQDATGIDVMNLYQKLVENGIIQSPTCEKQHKNNRSKSITVEFSKPETLKLRNMRIVNELYSGAQCDICTLRFTRKSGVYASHLDWHYQIKRHSLGQKTNWWCHLSEFPRSEQDMGHISWFDKQKSLDPFSIYEKLTVPAKDFGLMPKCSLCHEEINQFYDDITDEWLLKNAVVHNRKLCHPICCLKENEHNVSWLHVEMDMKKEVSQKDDLNKISNDSTHTNIPFDKKTGSTVEIFNTVLSSKVITDENVNDLPNKEINNGPSSTDFQDIDKDEVVIILPKMEIVDLSKDDINHLDSEMAFHEPLSNLETATVEENDEHQNLLNEDDSKGLAEPSLTIDYKSTINDYNEAPFLDSIKNDDIAINLLTPHSSYKSNSEEIELKFNYLSSKSPKTTKPLLMGAVMTVQPDIIKGEIDSSMCSIM